VFILKVVNIKEIEKKILPESHGETALYQNVIEGDFPKTDFGGMRMWIITLKPGADNTYHVHEKGDQFYFVLEGCPTVEVGDERREAKPWDFFYLPAGLPHRVSNDTKEICIVQGLGAGPGYLLLRFRNMVKRILGKR
jgi:mannose-6-phosphate isomerase-like protein (cupin superfamily)